MQGKFDTGVSRSTTRYLQSGRIEVESTGRGGKRLTSLTAGDAVIHLDRCVRCIGSNVGFLTAGFSKHCRCHGLVRGHSKGKQRQQN